MSAPDLAIIIPAYKEAENLAQLLPKVKQQCPAAELIVVDDGSPDQTSQVATAHGARVLRLTPNRGKGGALKAGFGIATAKYIVQIDADGQFLPEEIPRFVDALNAGADVVFGSRFVRGSAIEPGAMAWENNIAHRVICWAGWLASGIRVHDVMAGFKAWRRECALAMDLQSPHFGYEAETLVRAGQLGYKLAEVPVSFRYRAKGASNVHKLRDGCRVLSTIASTAWGRPRRAQTASSSAA